MRSLLAIILLAAVGVGSAMAQRSAEVEAAKRAGAQAAGTAASAAPQIDASGNLVKNPDGSLATQPLGAEAMRGALRMFQADTGLSGTDFTGSPANRNQAGSARIAVAGFSDFSCAQPQTRTFNAANLAFRVQDCNVDAANHGFVTLSMCDAVLRGGTCAQDSEFSAPFQVAAGATVSLGGMQLGLGCNSVRSCRLSVSGSHTFGGDDQALRQQARVRAADPSGMVATLREAAVGGDYVARMREIGQPLVDCAAANAATGQAATCDGSQVVQTAGPGQAERCSTQRRCLDESVQVLTTTRSCTRAFTFTERVSRYRYDQALTCSFTIDDSNPATPGVRTSSCSDAQLESASAVIARTEEVCDEQRTVNNVTTCVRRSWQEQRVDLTARSPLSETSDLPVKQGENVCDTNLLSETRSWRCPNASHWFGRTLPPSQCVASFFDEATGEPSGVFDMDFRNRPGCGICLEPEVSEICYAQPGSAPPDSSCEITDLAGCQLTRVAPRTFTGDGGLVASQEETYTCTTEARQCVRYSSEGSDPSCVPTDMAFGSDQIRTGTPKADGSFGNAMVAAAALDSVAQGLRETQGDTLPLLFNGSDMRCDRATGGPVGSLLQRNCCRMDLQRPIRDRLIQDGCSENEARLAAQRRARNTVYLGEYCSRRAPWPIRTCLRRTQTYCAFTGILPRILHEQGREQLNRMASSAVGANISRVPLTFTYYDAGGGSWAPVQVVGGTRVTAWQWPSYCANPAQAAERLATDPQALDCSGALSVWFAACEGEDCGDLPAEPGAGSLGWSLLPANPLENVTTALTRHTVVTGACSPGSGQCQYTVSGWPLGQSGRGVMSRDIGWALFSTAEDEPPPGAPAPAVFELNNLGDLMFRTHSVRGLGGSSAVPATVRLDHSSDGGQTWRTFDLPTDLRGREVTLPGTDTVVTGFCEGMTNSCEFRFTGTVSIQAKPWGSAHHPDCSGFTAGQLAAIDFGRLDLSEWLATILPNGGSGATPSEAQLADLARQQFQEHNRMMSSGQVSAAAPVSAQFARITPAEGFGPFTARLLVSGFWPETTGDPLRDTRRVTSVTVNWDDCSAPQTLAPVAPERGRGFEGTHRFENPQLIHEACGRGALQRSIVHQISLTVQYQDSGALRTQTVTLPLENAWGHFPAGAGGAVSVPQRVQGTPAGAGAPPPPRP